MSHELWIQEKSKLRYESQVEIVKGVENSSQREPQISATEEVAKENWAYNIFISFFKITILSELNLIKQVISAWHMINPQPF